MNGPMSSVASSLYMSLTTVSRNAGLIFRPLNIGSCLVRALVGSISARWLRHTETRDQRHQLLHRLERQTKKSRNRPFQYHSCLAASPPSGCPPPPFEARPPARHMWRGGGAVKRLRRWSSCLGWGVAGGAGAYAPEALMGNRLDFARLEEPWVHGAPWAHESGGNLATHDAARARGAEVRWEVEWWVGQKVGQSGLWAGRPWRSWTVGEWSSLRVAWCVRSV